MSDVHVAVHDFLHWLNDHGWRLFWALFFVSAVHGAARRRGVKRNKF